MEFQKLGDKERKLLLTALDIDIDMMRCQFCEERVSYDYCGIMPPIETKELATIICNSALCMAEYLGEIEDKKNANEKTE